MPLTHQDILDNQGDPALLDRLDIRNERGYIVAMFGLGAELFIAPRDKLTMRKQLLEAERDYYELFKDKLDRYLLPDQRRSPKVKGDPFPHFYEAMHKQPLERGFAVRLFHKMKRAEQHDGPTPYMIDFLEYSKDELCFFNAFMPVGAEGGGYHFQTLLSAYLRWCNLLKPAHGTAGFSLIFEGGLEGTRLPTSYWLIGGR